jgi:hypothetical protein
MRIILYSILVIALGSLFLSEIVYADCPSCDSDVTPLHGTASAGQPATIDGRPAISVRIDGSWDTSPGSGQTKANVWNAVNQGLSRWNGATDVSGIKSNYYFDLRQTDGNAQIKIVLDSSLTGVCAQTTGGPGGPYTIHLPVGADLRSLEALTNTIQHELGHVYGLDHPDGTCPGNQSIMKGNPGKMVNGHLDPCGGTSRSLTANDVQKANLTTSTPTGAPAGTCAYTWQYGPHELQGPPPNDYVEPIYYYNETCYYYYTAKDYYTCVTIDGDTSCSYDSTRYFLDEVVCF